jgi:transcription elongation factor GreA
VSERPLTNERVPLTQQGRRQIEDEARRLETRLSELRELLEDAHADRTADDDERAAALALLDEHARLEARLNELRAILESAVDAEPVATDVVGVGTRVVVRDEEGEQETYTVVSPAEAAPGEGRISVNSPLGQALSGRRPGEKASVAAPSGSWEVEVVSIEAAV